MAAASGPVASGDVVAGLTRVVRQAGERLGQRMREGQPRPSWAWCCSQTLRVLQEYSMGTTIGILDSELQMLWSKSGGSRGRGELAALALEHRHDPLTRMLELEVVGAPSQLVPGQVDLLDTRDKATGERVQCILPAKFESLRADQPPVIAAGRLLRVSGCRMVRLPKPKPPHEQNGDDPAYGADGGGVLTLLPTPYTSVMLDTGPGAPGEVGDISSDDVLMMTFESGLSALLSACGGDVSLNVRVASIEPVQQEAGPRNTNAPRRPMCWRSVVLADDDSADTCHLRLSDDQVLLADQFAEGDYIGLQNPRVVSEPSQGIHLEVDDGRTIVYVRESSKSTVRPHGSTATSAAAGGSTFHSSNSDGGTLIRVLEIDAAPKPLRARRGSIGYEDEPSSSSSAGSASGGTPPPTSSLGSQPLSADDAAMRRQLTLRCEAIDGTAEQEEATSGLVQGGSHRGKRETAMVVVEYTARRDGFKDLAPELHAGQVLWVAGLEAIATPRPLSGRWRTAAAAAAAPVAAADSWFSLQLPVDTSRALNSGATSSSAQQASPAADEKGFRGGELVMVSCAVGLLAAPWVQQPRSLQCCLRDGTQLAHCRATLTNIDVLQSSDAPGRLGRTSPGAGTGTGVGPNAPPLATQFSQGSTATQSTAVAADATRLGESLRLTFDDGSTSLCVAVHPRAVEALWHTPLHELVQLSAAHRDKRLGEALGVTFELLLTLVPPLPRAHGHGSQSTAVGAPAPAPPDARGVEQPSQQLHLHNMQEDPGPDPDHHRTSMSMVEYRLDGCARCTPASVSARLRAQLKRVSS